MFRILAVRLIALVAALMVVVVGSMTLAGPASAANGVSVYEVAISGTASGNPFARTGALVVGPTVDRVATTNGVNQFEVCLQSGSPAAAPETGAIKFGTNSACFGGRAALDLAVTGWTGSDFIVRPDANLAYSGFNGWNARSGIAAFIYYPIGGQAAFRFGQDGTLSGSLQLQGVGGGGLGSGTYTASLTGRLVG